MIVTEIKNQAIQKLVAKVATKNRQNRHLAEFRQTYYPKVVITSFIRITQSKVRPIENLAFLRISDIF